MDSLKGIITDIHMFLVGGVRTLPLTIAGTMTILGLFTANYAMMFFLVGFLIVTPAASAILNKLVELLVVSIGAESWVGSLFVGRQGDTCSVSPPFTTIKKPVRSEPTAHFCSTSLAMSVFFLGYILTNAVSLYQRDQADNADPVKVANRTSHALLAIASIVIFSIIILIFRMMIGCESKFGIVIGTAAFGAAGYGWYQMLSSTTSQDRLADLFGISNRILASSATSPIACIAT